MTTLASPATNDSGIEWVGKIPAHWKIIQLKRIAGIQTGITLGNRYGDLRLTSRPYIRVANVQDGYLDLEQITFIDLPPESVPRYELQSGDVLMTEGGDFDKLGRGYVWEGQIAGCLHQNHVFAVRPKRTLLLSRFLASLMTSAHGKHYFTSTSQQTTNLASTNSTKIGGFPILLPPPSEQHQIVSFLDRKTAQIDVLINKKQRLIELLQEKRQALISHVVTKGLDPNVPMKDSGVEWLGTIPAHWAVERLKFRMTKIEQGWSPQCDNRQADPGEWGVLKVGCMNSGVYDESENKALPAELEPIPDYEVCVGDVLMSRSNTVELVGAVGRVHETQGRILLCDKLYRLGLDSNRLHPDFAVHLLRSRAARLQLERDASGASSSMKNISNELVTNMVLSFPPLDEQKHIVHFLTHSLEQSRQIERKVVQQITKLQEYRQTLISAAVTGKIDVRKEANP